MVFLSATSPNAVEFSEWIGRTKQTKVYVIQTEKRPVPLKHYIYDNKKLIQIIGDDGKFLDKNYHSIIENEKNVKDDKKKRFVPQGEIIKFANFLVKEEHTPVYIYTYNL